MPTRRGHPARSGTLPSVTSRVDEISDQFVERFAALDPISATFEGIPGYDDELTDYSPDGIAERLAHARTTLRELDGAPVTSDRERVAAEVIRRELEVAVDLSEAGEDLRALRVIGSPVSSMRISFDVLPRDTLEDWETIAARTAAVPRPSTGSSGRSGRASAKVSWRHSARPPRARSRPTPGAVAATATRRSSSDSSTSSMPAASSDPALRARLDEAARRATAAYAALGRFLVDEYLPAASEEDAVGSERYERWALSFNGTRLDLRETYAWGWDEAARIEAAMGDVGERILPGEPLRDVIEHLEHDPTRTIEGVDRVPRMAPGPDGSDGAELDDVHFDIPDTDAARRSDDRSTRRGGSDVLHGPVRGLQPTRDARGTRRSGARTFPLWGEVSTAYHEGVPGHHLQIGMTRVPGGRPQPVPAHARVELRARGGLGALRRAAHGRARLPRRPGVRARDAARAA